VGDFKSRSLTITITTGKAGERDGKKYFTITIFKFPAINFGKIFSRRKSLYSSGFER